jgi:hypothetical protein
MIVFSAWFRLIFVIVAYENVSGHTFGFLCLQLVLIAIACLNVWFVVEAKIEYKFLGGPKTHYFAYLYLFLNVCIGVIKAYLTAYVVTMHSYPSWANSKFGGREDAMVPGQVIDLIWMIFNAIIPFIIAFVRSRSERPLEFTINFQAPIMVEEEGGEETAPGSLPK